jgi:membrane-associated protein
VEIGIFALADTTLAVNPLDATDLIATFGLIGVLAIIFAETGLLVGFFFPGDSLLFLAGIAASPFANQIFEGVQLNLAALLIGAPLCAIAGAQLGHLLGARYGRRMFDGPTHGCSSGSTWRRPSTTSTSSARRRRSSWPASSRSCELS